MNDLGGAGPQIPTKSKPRLRASDLTRSAIEPFVESKPILLGQFVGAHGRAQPLGGTGNEILTPSCQIVGQGFAGVREPLAHQGEHALMGGQAGNEPEHDAFNLWRREECPRGNQANPGDREEPLEDHAHRAPPPVSCGGHELFAHLALHHENRAVEDWLAFSDFGKQRPGDVVGHVGDDPPGMWQPVQDAHPIGLQGIEEPDIRPGRERGGGFDHAGVEVDGHNHSARGQGAGQDPGPGADLQNTGKAVCRINDLADGLV